MDMTEKNRNDPQRQSRVGRRAARVFRQMRAPKRLLLGALLRTIWRHSAGEIGEQAIANPMQRCAATAEMSSAVATAVQVFWRAGRVNQ